MRAGLSRVIKSVQPTRAGYSPLVCDEILTGGEHLPVRSASAGINLKPGSV
jgi:hypothetical protein